MHRVCQLSVPHFPCLDGRTMLLLSESGNSIHSIKMLAVEMSYAMVEGDWKHLGELLARHWQINQVLNPHTTNAPINTILDQTQRYSYGAKPAGAGGGGFLMLLARGPEAAMKLKAELTQHSLQKVAVVSYSDRGRTTP